MNEKTKLGENGIYDAKTLGTPKVILLGLQHMFAMFGATILVPMLTGLDVSTTLLFAGLGTLLFHLITKGKVPAFLGSSFAFLGGYAAIAPMTNAAGEAVDNAALLPYACFGVACSGLLYLGTGALDQDLRHQQGNAFLPSYCYRPHHYRHRSDSCPSPLSTIALQTGSSLSWQSLW